jgi:hypothetical protein
MMARRIAAFFGAVSVSIEHREGRSNIWHIARAKSRRIL